MSKQDGKLIFQGTDLSSTILTFVQSNDLQCSAVSAVDTNGKIYLCLINIDWTDGTDRLFKTQISNPNIKSNRYEIYGDMHPTELEKGVYRVYQESSWTTKYANSFVT